MNAKQELEGTLKASKSYVKCAKISRGDYDNEEKNVYILKLNYDEKAYDTFLKSLDFTYNNGYGSQELFGTVWFENGTWLSRGEYDGSEWWDHNQTPEIPKDCI